MVSKELEMIRDALNIEERMMKTFKTEFFELLKKSELSNEKKDKMSENLLVLAFETLEHEKALNEIYLRLLSKK